jgi:mevalonate kinase
LLSFPAKVLLFGEYTILNGSKALAIPYPELQGHWSFEKISSEARELSRESLARFLKEHKSSAIDWNHLIEDFEKGLWFDSSIPHGYGLGSSGAFIAALFERYGDKSLSHDQIREGLARLEDFFHGSSSGIDPFVSFINKPLLIHSFKEVEILEKKLDLSGFFLLNTGKARQTAPLVKTYQEKMKDPEFKKGCADILSRDVNLAIEGIVTGKNDNTFHHMWHISKFQWDFFPEMIPTSMRGLWTKGLESGEYALKLCGAGGGGFLLGHSKKKSPGELKDMSSSFELRFL